MSNSNERRQLSQSPHVVKLMNLFRAQAVMKDPKYRAWRSMTWSQINDLLVVEAIGYLCPDLDTDDA